MQFYGGDETTETQRFIKMFDKFFDCLNVRSPDEYRRKRKPDLKPYTCSSDERLTVSLCVPSIDYKRLVRVFCLQWLESDFLGYLKEWETSVKGREGFTNAQKTTMMLSRETLEGLHITGKNAMTHAIHYNYILRMLSIPQSIMQYGHSVRSLVIYLVLMRAGSHIF